MTRQYWKQAPPDNRRKRIAIVGGLAVTLLSAVLGLLSISASDYPVLIPLVLPGAIATMLLLGVHGGGSSEIFSTVVFVLFNGAGWALIIYALLSVWNNAMGRDDS